MVDEQDPQVGWLSRCDAVWSVRRRPSWASGETLTGVANLFNGALLSDVAIEAVGVPDPRLFVRGDEVEMHRRLRRSGLPFGTCTESAYLHPQGRDDWAPVLAGWLWVLVPRDPQRQDLTYRNLGYLTARLRWRRWPGRLPLRLVLPRAAARPRRVLAGGPTTRAGRRERFGLQRAAGSTRAAPPGELGRGPATAEPTRDPGRWPAP